MFYHVMTTFSQVSYNFSVSRTAPDLFHVGTIVATDKDRDIGGGLKFSLQVNPYFDINTLGMIRLIQLDPECDRVVCFAHYKHIRWYVLRNHSG